MCTGRMNVWYEDGLTSALLTSQAELRHLQAVIEVAGRVCSSDSVSLSYPRLMHQSNHELSYHVLIGRCMFV